MLVSCTLNLLSIRASLFNVCRRVRRRRTQHGCRGRRRRRRHDRRHSRPRKRKKPRRKPSRKSGRSSGRPARQETLRTISHSALWASHPHLCLCFFPQTHNYFTDNEADGVRMMEEMEKLCDRLELTRYSWETWGGFTAETPLHAREIWVWFVVCRRWMNLWLLGIKSRVKRLWRNRWETQTTLFTLFAWRY